MKNNSYDPKKIEKKWQKEWERKKAFAAKDDSKKKKYYSLMEFPYPSGDGLHTGHVRGYTAMDVISRKRRMEGYNVLFPIGFDAFGLPTENYAIKTGMAPDVVTKKNIKRYTEQFRSLGFSFDWSRVVDTTDPKYYKWTQWIFLQLLKHGLAYKDKISINWCPKDKIGLANEEVISGKCERCGTAVEKREKEQWMLAITKYADKLDRDLDKTEFLEKIKLQQRNWIGRSEGAEIEFKVASSKQQVARGIQSANIKVFTTRPDTLFGTTYLVLAPENPIIGNWKLEIRNWNEVEQYINEAKKKAELERTAEDKDKTGVELKGVKAINPANGEEIPVWIADYVLAHYGTGAVMAVPAHDERDFAFAKKYGLGIRDVVAPYYWDATESCKPREDKENIKRTIAVVVLKHWSEEKYLCLKWKMNGWKTFVTGGIEKNENYEEGARREIHEETGYKNIRFIKHLGGPNISYFFAPHKNKNQFVEGRGMYFELINAEKNDISPEEKDKHELVWIEREKVKEFLESADMMGDQRYLKLFWQRFQTDNYCYTDNGLLINSGKFDGMSSEQAKKEITKFVGGKWVTKFKLRDWVFSRQRYWGEPIPVVHCEHCKEKAQEAISISFYRQDTWKALIDGTKTIETRALNPEEPERYFGNIKKGEYVKAINRVTGESQYFLIKQIWKFNNLKDLFKKPKSFLLKIATDKNENISYKKWKEDYKKNSPDYFERIEKNGLVAWQVEKVTPGSIPLSEKDLPLKLPKVAKYQPTDTGESPLAAMTKWVNVKCPVCGGKARRETDTMPNWAGSSWYYLAYTSRGISNFQFPISNKKSKTKPTAGKNMDYWMPVDWYNGGMEHTTLHLLYSRFWNKFLFDIGVVPTSEPYKKRTSHGMILAGDGEKMSKSRGNVINPDDIVKTYGADTLRLYEMFMGPFDQAISWGEENIIGVRRFLEKVWKVAEKIKHDTNTRTGANDTNKFETLLHKTIQKVSDDIETIGFNTAVSSMMILVNEMEKIVASDKGQVAREDFEKFIKILSPFAPHICEEIWGSLGHKTLISAEEWPKADKKKMIESSSTIVVQINGRVRAELSMPADSVEEDALEAAKKSESVDKWISGKKIKKVIYVKNRLINLVVE
jgi:leucyl-tRNA synthetase